MTILSANKIAIIKAFKPLNSHITRPYQSNVYIYKQKIYYMIGIRLLRFDINLPEDYTGVIPISILPPASHRITVTICAGTNTLALSNGMTYDIQPIDQPIINMIEKTNEVYNCNIENRDKPLKLNDLNTIVITNVIKKTNTRIVEYLRLDHHITSYKVKLHNPDSWADDIEIILIGISNG